MAKRTDHQNLASSPRSPHLSSELVTVIIPAYNAEGTLGQTLLSVRAQTHRNLQIIVVDDGSADGTYLLAAQQAAADDRITVIRQSNSGVAAARNAALKRARGRFVAPVDADDLWARDKLERQLATFASAPSSVGLVYTWFAVVSERGEVRSRRRRGVFDGDVLWRMCLGNLVGNASSALMPTSVVMEMGGYDEALHRQGAPGCEDLKLYWLIAEKYEFRCVPEFLTGYRVGRANMSSNLLCMLKSFDLVMSEMEVRRPELAALFHRGRCDNYRWLMTKAALAGSARDFFAISRKSRAHDLVYHIFTLARLPPHVFRVKATGLLRMAIGQVRGGNGDLYAP